MELIFRRGLWSVVFFFFYNLFFCFFFSLIENYLISIHVFPILNPPPSSLPTPSLGVVPVHQPQASASCIEPGLASRFIHDVSHVSMNYGLIKRVGICSLLLPFEIICLRLVLFPFIYCERTLDSRFTPLNLTP